MVDEEGLCFDGIRGLQGGFGAENELKKSYWLSFWRRWRSEEGENTVSWE